MYIYNDIILVFHLFVQVTWFSSGGTKSVVHNDDVDNINCLFRGKKQLMFMDYEKYKTKVSVGLPLSFRIVCANVRLDFVSLKINVSDTIM